MKERKQEFVYKCPKCGAITYITDYAENESFVFCYCELDEHGDGMVMEKIEKGEILL